jgi:hypothetical protein
VDEIKISPSGHGAYFHVQKPVTYAPSGGIVPWVGVHIEGLCDEEDPRKQFTRIDYLRSDGVTVIWAMAYWSWSPGGPYYLATRIEANYIPYVGWWPRSISLDHWRRRDKLGKNSELLPALEADIASMPPVSSWDKGSWAWTIDVTRSVSLRKEAPNFQFKYNELNDFELYNEFGLWTQRWRTLAGNAYINAAQNLPSTANNSIQNVVQIIDLIKDIKEGNLGRSARDFVKSNAFSKAKQAWLTYRYSYETTKLDLQEYRELTERIQSLRSMKKIETFGQFATEAAFCRCCFKVNVSDMIPHNFSEWLHSYGFYLKAADVWDDIPFSFMVDWFWHLGDLLEFFDASGEAAEVRPADIWYSFLTKYDNQTCYFRIPGEAITNVPFLDFNTGSSTKVKAMRIADTVSIFT